MSDAAGGRGGTTGTETDDPPPAAPSRVRHPLVLASVLVVVGLLAAATLSRGNVPWSPDPTTTTSPVPLVPIEMGVFRASGVPSEIDAYEGWLGREVPWVLDFFPWEDWSAIDDPSWWINQWSGTDRRVVYSAPMLPEGGGVSLRAGARGAYDDHWRRFARTFVERGAPEAVIRIGWEFNGRFYPWSAEGREEEFVTYWRRIVDAMRSVPGADFTFDWSSLAGAPHVDLEAAYPGDDYVDVIGMDVYDQSALFPERSPEEVWAQTRERPFGLDWHQEFARQRGKPVSFPEWGLMTYPEVGVVGNEDNPHFIREMRIRLQADDVAYAMYFEVDADDGEHRLMEGRFPQAARVFRELFGGGAAHSDGTEE
jgi:hypothetical protein